MSRRPRRSTLFPSTPPPDLKTWREPCLVARQIGIGAGEKITVIHAAARLDHAGSRDIGQRNQRARGKGEDTAGASWLVGEHARHDENGAADLDAPANCQAERLQHARLDPRSARSR